MKPTQNVSAHLNEIATIIYKRLEKLNRKKGWFSKWISEKLIEHYYKDMESIILKELMLTKQKERDKIEREIEDIAKRLDILVISNFEIANWLGARDVKAHGQHIGGGFNHPFGYLKLTQALHGSALPDGSYGGNPAGILLTTHNGEKIYLACDTGLFAGMKLIGEEGIDLAVLPIGDNFTMGPDDALRAVKMIRPKHVVPVHYNTWPLIEQDPVAWAARVEKETQSKAHVLKSGGALSL